jgi:hypothetical protein
MLIISKKKDYYDGVVGTMGVDKTLVYNRELTEVESKDFPSMFRLKDNRTENKIRNAFTRLGGNVFKKEYRSIYETYSHFIVGFCGKLYVGFQFYTPHKFGEVDNVLTTYDFDVVREIVQNEGWHSNLTEDYNYIMNYNPIEIFREFNVPVFVYDDYDYNSRRNGKFYLNPILKEYEFYKIFDAFQAFQEIEMFLGGVLGKGEKEIVEVADKYKIEQFGFDKWSFRKEPSGKKI